MVGLLAVAAHGVVNLWSYGVLGNHERDAETPPVAAIANGLTFVTGAALLIWSFVG